MEQVNSKTTTIEQKITGSGVFKLDERGRPEGIIKLAADKSLSTRPGNFTPCRRGDLQEMIAEIAREMAKYLTPPSDRDRLQELLDEFEGGLSSYLNEWGLKDIEELTPHRKKFVNKAKKIIRKSLSKGRKASTKILRKIDTKPSQRRDALIYSMHRLFECLKKSETPLRTLVSGKSPGSQESASAGFRWLSVGSYPWMKRKSRKSRRSYGWRFRKFLTRTGG